MAEQVTSAKATAKTVRIPARKARLVIDFISGKSVAYSLGIFKFTPSTGVYLFDNVLESAVAHAVNSFDLDVEDLYVCDAIVNEGPTLKRFRPRTKGCASPINKRTIHITVV